MILCIFAIKVEHNGSHGFFFVLMEGSFPRHNKGVLCDTCENPILPSLPQNYHIDTGHKI